MNRKQRIAEKNAYIKAEKYISKKKYTCMHKGCNEAAIKSHSQQKGGPLKAIQLDGKLYRLNDDFQRSLNMNTSKMEFKFALKGVKESSVFPGFCSEHEKIFSIFEDNDLVVNDQKQACALFYRTVSYEKARKRREYDRWDFLQDKLIDIYGFSAMRQIATQVEQFKVHMRKNCDYLIERSLGFMNEGDYSDLKTKWVKLPYNIGVSCSSTINLHLDDYLKYTIDNPGEPLPSFTFNLIPTEDSTHIIVSWLKEHDEFATWLSDVFDSKEMLEIYLNRFCFCDSEDACISPKLFEKIENPDEIIENMHHVFQRGTLKLENIPKVIQFQDI